MSRFVHVLMVIGLLVLIPMLAFAQDVTPTPAAPPSVQTVVPVTPLAIVSPTPEAVQGTPQFTATPSLVIGEEVPILISARSDLELLASQSLGNTRPPGWSGSLEINDPDLALLLRLDLEILATVSISGGERPAGWFGAIPSTPYAIARDIRHDLELLADNLIEPNVRPPGWAGGTPIMRCDRATQNLVGLLERGGVFTLSVDPSAPDYCIQAANTASQFTEANLLRSIPGGTGGADVIQAASEASNVDSSDSGGAFVPTGRAAPIGGDVVTPAFLDRYATQQVGRIPEGVTFSPVARSYTLFSNMMVVRGVNFEVFVDYKTTTLSEEQFRALPDIDRGEISTVCNADWCTDVLLIDSFIGGVGPGGRQVVSVNNINYAYDGGDEGNTTLIRVSLCPNPRPSSNCEPVTQVILADGKQARSTGRVSGEYQWRLPVGHSYTSLRSRSYYTVELWVDPPQYR